MLDHILLLKNRIFRLRNSLRQKIKREKQKMRKFLSKLCFLKKEIIFYVQNFSISYHNNEKLLRKMKVNIY